MASLPTFDQAACPHADPTLTPWSSLCAAEADWSGSVLSNLSAAAAAGMIRDPAGWTVLRLQGAGGQGVVAAEKVDISVAVQRSRMRCGAVDMG